VPTQQTFGIKHESLETRMTELKDSIELHLDRLENLFEQLIDAVNHRDG
jgi:hypothetical protein